MKSIVLLLSLLVCTQCITSKESGPSRSVGTVSRGSLVRGQKFDFKGKNYHYFSLLSYTLLNRAWVHHKVLETTEEAYSAMHRKFPNREFMVMECSQKEGGRMWPHRTHQNGTSIDFATPLTRQGKPWGWDQAFGLGHYAMDFDAAGRLRPYQKVAIDFEVMAQHILALDVAARKRGMYVKKVIFKLELKDDLFRTATGQQLQERGIYFAQRLPRLIDEVHDDHYHIDFGFLNN